MLFFRSLLFTSFLVLLTFFVCVTGCVIAPFSKKTLRAYIRWWSKSLIWGARVFAGIRLEIKGKENLPVGEGYIIACKHQSAFETTIFHSFIDIPCYIFKTEMTKVPFLGKIMQEVDCIPVDRNERTKALKKIVTESKARIDEGKTVVIFPEGTRVAVGEHKKYSSGVAMIYDVCKVKIVPVAINSGYLWPRNSFIKKAGTITLQILPPIPAGLDKREMLEKLEQCIEETTSSLPSPFENTSK